MIFQLSEESRERISKVLDLGRVALHYGWIPFVIYVGEYESEYSVGADTSVLTSVWLECVISSHDLYVSINY